MRRLGVRGPAGFRLEEMTFVPKGIIPPGASATVDFPVGGGVMEVGSGAHEFSVPVP